MLIPARADSPCPHPRCPPPLLTLPPVPLIARAPVNRPTEIRHRPTPPIRSHPPRFATNTAACAPVNRPRRFATLPPVPPSTTVLTAASAPRCPPRLILQGGEGVCHACSSPPVPIHHVHTPAAHPHCQHRRLCPRQPPVPIHHVPAPVAHLIANTAVRAPYCPCPCQPPRRFATNTAACADSPHYRPCPCQPPRRLCPPLSPAPILQGGEGVCLRAVRGVCRRRPCPLLPVPPSTARADSPCPHPRCPPHCQHRRPCRFATNTTARAPVNHPADSPLTPPPVPPAVPRAYSSGR